MQRCCVQRPTAWHRTLHGTAAHSFKVLLQVVAGKRWAWIGRHFNPPSSMTDLSFQIKKIYNSKLLPFEEVGQRLKSEQCSASHLYHVVQEWTVIDRLG